MTNEELKDLDIIVQRLRRNVAQSRVDYKENRINTYAWGLADGLLLGYEMIKAFQDKYPGPLKPIGEPEEEPNWPRYIEGR